MPLSDSPHIEVRFEHLLLACYDHAELVDFLRALPDGLPLLADLRANTTLRQRATEIAGLLKRRGMINADAIRVLTEQRPARRELIAEFAASLPAPPSPPPAPSAHTPAPVETAKPAITDPNTRDLIEHLRRDEVVIVAGAGVSIAACGGPTTAPTASWLGLLHDGVDTCAPHRKPTWPDAKHRDLNDGELDEIISVASQIETTLDAPHGEFVRWLGRTVGALTITNPSVPAAIHALGTPIATTNYDDVLATVTGKPPLVWADEAMMHMWMRGEYEAIFHLHGHWRRPETVVLGNRTYDAVLRSDATQAAMRSLLTSKTLLFVGCGGTFEDPNFSRMLTWCGDALRSSPYRHYALVRADEVEVFRAKHPIQERLVPIPFGSDHADLPRFLTELKRQVS